MLEKTEIHLKRLSLAKSEIIWPLKHIIVVIDYDPLNKIGNHESIDTNLVTK